MLNDVIVVTNASHDLTSSRVEHIFVSRPRMNKTVVITGVIEVPRSVGHI